MDVVNAAVIAMVVLTLAIGVLYRLRRDVVGPPMGNGANLLASAALGLFLVWSVTANVAGPDRWATRPVVAVTVAVLEVLIFAALVVDTVRTGRRSGRHAEN